MVTASTPRDRVDSALLEFLDTVTPEENQPLGKYGIEPLDFLTIMHDLGIPAYQYASGERVSEQGLIMLRDCGLLDKFGSDQIDFYSEHPLETTRLPDVLSKSDLVRIVEYKDSFSQRP